MPTSKRPTEENEDVAATNPAKVGETTDLVTAEADSNLTGLLWWALGSVAGSVASVVEGTASTIARGALIVLGIDKIYDGDFDLSFGDTPLLGSGEFSASKIVDSVVSIQGSTSLRIDPVIPNNPVFLELGFETAQGPQNLFLGILGKEITETMMPELAKILSGIKVDRGLTLRLCEREVVPGFTDESQQNVLVDASAIGAAGPSKLLDTLAVILPVMAGSVEQSRLLKDSSATSDEDMFARRLSEGEESQSPTPPNTPTAPLPGVESFGRVVEMQDSRGSTPAEEVVLNEAIKNQLSYLLNLYQSVLRGLTSGKLISDEAKRKINLAIEGLSLSSSDMENINGSPLVQVLREAGQEKSPILLSKERMDRIESWLKTPVGQSIQAMRDAHAKAAKAALEEKQRVELENQKRMEAELQRIEQSKLDLMSSETALRSQISDEASLGSKGLMEQEQELADTLKGLASRARAIAAAQAHDNVTSTKDATGLTKEQRPVLEDTAQQISKLLRFETSLRKDMTLSALSELRDVIEQELKARSLVKDRELKNQKRRAEELKTRRIETQKADRVDLAREETGARETMTYEEGIEFETLMRAAGREIEALIDQQKRKEQQAKTASNVAKPSEEGDEDTAPPIDAIYCSEPRPQDGQIAPNRPSAVPVQKNENEDEAAPSAHEGADIKKPPVRIDSELSQDKGNEGQAAERLRIEVEIKTAMEAAINIVREGAGSGMGPRKFFRNPFIEDANIKVQILDDEKTCYETDKRVLGTFVIELARPRKTLGGIGQAEPGETNSYRKFVETLTDDGLKEVLGQLMIRPRDTEPQQRAALEDLLKNWAVEKVNALEPGIGPTNPSSMGS